jgi:hypothetical protein
LLLLQAKNAWVTFIKNCEVLNVNEVRIVTRHHWYNSSKQAMYTCSYAAAAEPQKQLLAVTRASHL